MEVAEATPGLNVLDAAYTRAHRNSLSVVTRCSISGVLWPVYDQITVTTGILISGKMSVGLARIAMHVVTP